MKNELYECANRKCGHVYKNNEAVYVPEKRPGPKTGLRMTGTCPKCGCETFYMAKRKNAKADDETLPANRLVNVRRRVLRAMKHTCPASRHLLMMAEALIKDGKYRMIEEEPEHCAGSILAVLESLWKLRNRERARRDAAEKRRVEREKDLRF